MSTRKLPSLDALTSIRFFLALWVVIFHQTCEQAMLTPYVPLLPSWLFNLVSTGYAAVGIFFLLSGFLLSYGYNLAHKWDGVARRRFWSARFARIYPVYLFGLLVSGPFILIQILLAADVRTALVLVAKGASAVTLVQAWSPKSVFFWNTPGWSLSVEAFFYLCFPVIGTALWKIERRRTILLTATLIWVTGMISTALVAKWTTSGFLSLGASSMPVEVFWVTFIKFNPLLRLPEFCAGILLAKLFFLVSSAPVGFLKSGNGAVLYLPAMALEFVAFTSSSHFSYPLVHNGLMLPIHGLLILGLALGGGPLSKLLSGRSMVLLGQASYALYILHGPINSWIVFAYHRVTHAYPFGMGWSLSYICLTVVVSVVTFRCVEEPARKFLLARTRRSTVLASVPPAVAAEI